jgi:hypothetical protein
MGSIVKTIVSLPEQYKGSVAFVINNNHFEVAARNILITLIALTTSNEDEAVHCMLHIWYSAFITARDREIITQNVLPLITVVLKLTEDRESEGEDQNDEKSVLVVWDIGTHKVKAQFTKANWKRLHIYLTGPPMPAGSPQGQQAERDNLHFWQGIHQACTSSSSHQDRKDRSFFGLMPTVRMCKDRFMADGLLLPFGANREDFVVPNP